MEGICVGMGIVIGTKFIFGDFGRKTMSNCVYNKTAEEQISFNSFISWDVACKLRRYTLLVSLVVCKGSDTSCHSVFD